MESVLDPIDPSGMFSKAGRASLEMYQLILQRDRILYNKKPIYFRKPLETNHKFLLFSSSLDEKSSQSPNIAKNKKSFHLANALSKHQPFSKMMSREMMQKIEKNDRRFGMYNPRYSQIFNKSSLFDKETLEEKIKENKPKSPYFRKIKAVSCHIDARIPLENEPKPPKIVGPVPLQYQLGREKYMNFRDVNEKRFELLELPGIYSKTQKVIGVSLKRIGRSRSNFHKDDCSKGLEYKPKYSLIWPKSSLKVPDFSKLLARKGLENSEFVGTSWLSNEETSFISHKIQKIPDFSKMLAREKDIDDSRISSHVKNN